MVVCYFTCFPARFVRRPRSVACCFSTLSQRLILPLFLSGHFSVFVLFCCHDFFLSRAEHPPPDLSVLKNLRRPTPRSGIIQKIRPVNTVPAGTFEGWRFFEKSCCARGPGLPLKSDTIRPGRSEALPLSTERSGGGCFVHRFQKEEWRQKRAQYRKLPLSRAKHRDTAVLMRKKYALRHPTIRKVRNIALSGNFADRIKQGKHLCGRQYVNEPDINVLIRSLWSVFSVD